MPDSQIYDANSKEWEAFRASISDKRSFRERFRDHHLNLVVKNIENIRQFTTQLMLVAGSLAVLASAGIGSDAIQIGELFNLGYVLLFSVVGYGAIHLKYVLEKENESLERQSIDYIAHFSKITAAEDRLLAERTSEAVKNYLDTMSSENKRVAALGGLDGIGTVRKRPDISLTLMVTLLCVALVSIALSLLLSRTCLENLATTILTFIVLRI